MPDLLDRLKTALADRYAVQHELGRGGMATVYLAEDLKHHRPVALKVLRPELAAALGPERFLREIELAAKLTHPHIVPLYDSGVIGGWGDGGIDSAGQLPSLYPSSPLSLKLLYYVMPYVEGESLRDRLTREKQLPVDDALQISREVADALSYAHARGVIHRDIKPENILLESGHAVVADFGIARAVDEAGGERLTGTGLSLGTPAYMSPEQAAGSRDLDGRSDLYALGCVLYEMLAGQPPFPGPTVDRMVHQHLTVEPTPITSLRPAVPAAVAAALARALAKTPADRFNPVAQFAEALRVAAPTAESPAGVGRAHGPDPLLVGGVFALAAAAVVAAALLLVLHAALPRWVLAGAIALAAAGVPLVIATALAERGRARGTGIRGWVPRLLTWRNTATAGVAGLAALALVTVAYLASRTLGIGPAATLIGTGAIAEREPLILADFANRTADSTHGTTVTELMRIGLSQSSAISIIDPVQVGRILGRMQRSLADGVPEAVALEAAEREGVKGVVAGEIAAVGTGYNISARLIAVDGTALARVHERAATEDGIIAAVDRLAGRLRERAGESLGSIRRSEPLDRSTTGSLAALRLLSQGFRASNQGDDARAMQYLEEAIALDSAFAMAWRKLAIILGNRGERRSRAVEAATRAYEYRDRLTERERYLVIGAYHRTVTNNRDQQISAYQTVLDRYPTDIIALNNLGTIYSALRDHERAADYYRRALVVDSTSRLHYSNLAGALGQMSWFDSASAVIEGFARRFPDNPEVAVARIMHAARLKDYATAERLGADLMAEQRGRVSWEATAYEWMGALDAMRGRMASAERAWARALTLTAERDLGGVYLARAARSAVSGRLLHDDPARARRRLDDALARYALEDLVPLDRPYAQLAVAYAATDDPARARQLVAEHEATADADHGRDAERAMYGALGVAALAEGRLEEAVAALRRYDDGNACVTCATVWLARAYDRMGNADSARVLYERFVTAPSASVFQDAGHLGHAYLRLGELYEQLGDRGKAAEYYGRLVRLWDQADPDMLGWVRQSRAALARLAGERTSAP
jgi:eukaryotic-like serine/threonine-protein kinase